MTSTCRGICKFPAALVTDAKSLYDILLRDVLNSAAGGPKENSSLELLFLYERRTDSGEMAMPRLQMPSRRRLRVLRFTQVAPCLRPVFCKCQTFETSLRILFGSGLLGVEKLKDFGLTIVNSSVQPS